MKRFLFIPLVLLLASGCTDTRAEQQRNAIEREIERRVEQRTKEYAERRLASMRMIVLGSIALVSVIAMCAIDTNGGPPEQPMRTVSPDQPPGQSPPKGQGRIIDLGS